MSKEKKHIFAYAHAARAPLALVLVSAAMVVGVYLQALYYPFVSDDGGYIVENMKLAKLGLPELWRLFVEPYNNYSEFLPLRDLSYWLDMTLFGLNPAAFRAHNIFLYLLCLPLVYTTTLALWRYFRPAEAASAPYAASAVTALFVMHPSHVEPVVWIAGRKDVLCGVFSLLALWLAVKARREHGLSAAHAAATMIALLAAILSKAVAVAVAPVIALLWIIFWRDIPASGRRRSLLLWPLAIFFLATGIATIYATTSVYSQYKIPIHFGHETITRALAILGWLARLTVSPESRHFYYPLFEDRLFPAMAALGAVVLAATALGGVMILRKRSLEGFALLSFVLICMPSLQLSPYSVPSYISNRFLFLALWPAMLLVVALAWRLKPASRAVLLLAIALPFAFQTTKQLREWRSFEVLLDANIRAYPGYYMPVLHRTLVIVGLPYNEAIQIASNITDPEVRNIMVKLLSAESDVADALSTEDPRTALISLLSLWHPMKQSPDQVKWNSHMLVVREKTKELYEKLWQAMTSHFAGNALVNYKAGLWALSKSNYGRSAVADFRAMVNSTRLPESIQSAAYMNLGLALLRSGRAGEAESPLLAALAQPQPDTRAYCVLSEVYTQNKRFEEAARAEADCRNRAVTVQSAINNLEEGNYPDALKEFGLLADNGDAAAQMLLGVMYENGHGVSQDYAQAAEWYGKASDRGNADAQYNLGVLYGDGLGVQKNLVQAHKWFSLSALAGKENAISAIKEIEANMVSGQIMEARTLAMEWQAKHR